MDTRELAGLIESLLFVASGPVDIQDLAKALETNREEIENALTSLTEERNQSGIRVQRSGTELQLVAAPESASHVQRFLGLESTTKLSNAALETLAIIAYQQPITRARIEAIRGVNSDHSVATLQAMGLIKEVGRLETVGHPAVFGTTFEFLQHFGLSCLEELPALEELERLYGSKADQEQTKTEDYQREDGGRNFGDPSSRELEPNGRGGLGQENQGQI